MEILHRIMQNSTETEIRLSKNNMNENKPYLMCDNSEKDGHAETIIDYVLSWSLRCAKYPFLKDNKPILYQYCKYMLCKLIGKLQDINNIDFFDVRVWKQEQYIDLWIEVDLLLNDSKESHAILVENKYYTGVHNNQLKRYKQIFDEYYADKSDFPSKNRHYILLTCIYDNDAHYEPLNKAAKEAGFELYHIYNLTDKSINYKESESDIFNELFIRDWV